MDNNSDISVITNNTLTPVKADFIDNSEKVTKTVTFKETPKIETQCYGILWPFILVSILVLIICFYISYPEAGWYQELNNYSWSSNMLVMGIILAVIVIIMACCTAIGYRDSKNDDDKQGVLFTYVASSLVLIMWFYVFYNAKNLDNAFYIGVVFLFIAFVQTYYVWKANTLAGYGMILYMLWAIFAAIITWNISSTNVVEV